VAGAQFSSVADVGYGLQNDPGALRCLLRIEMVDISTVTASSFVRLYGVDIEMLKQASNLNGLNIEIYAGFWPGLPLASEEAVYAGSIYCGTIFQAFGNWQDEDMTLDLLIYPGKQQQQSSTSSQGGGFSGSSSSPSSQRLLARQSKVGNLRPLPQRRRATARPLEGDGGGGGFAGLGGDIGSALSTIASSFGAGAGWGSTPGNIIHNWLPGETLSNAIRKTLTQAFPWCTIDIGIADLLTNTGAQDSGFYSSLEQFAAFAKQTSLSMMSGTQGAAGTMSSLVGAMAKGSGNAGLQSLADALSAASKNSPGSDDYHGIHTFIRCQRVIVTDNNPVNGIHVGPTLRFEELIGQPTWLQSNVITFRVPMRSDIYPSLTVTLPPETLEFVTPNTEQIPGMRPTLAVNFANQPVFLKQVTAIGDSRHPDGSSWSLQCVGIVTSAAVKAAQYPDSSVPGGTPPNPAPDDTTQQRLQRRAVRRY
jgi:hypothetical protein